jgi:uncharacterized membrane protein YkgB
MLLRLLTEGDLSRIVLLIWIPYEAISSDPIILNGSPYDSWLYRVHVTIRPLVPTHIGQLVNISINPGSGIR